jgi:hypothetical protein
VLGFFWDVRGQKMPPLVVCLPPRQITPELVHVSALLMLRDAADSVEVHFDTVDNAYRVGCGGRCDLVRDFDPGRKVQFAPFELLCGQDAATHTPPAGLVGAAWAALGPQILRLDGTAQSVLVRAHELLFAPIDRKRPAPTLEPLLPGLRQLNWTANPEAVTLAIRYTAATITAMLDELIRRENTLVLEQDDLWQAYVDAVHSVNDETLSRVMMLDAPSSAARMFLRRHDPEGHVLLVMAPVSVAVEDTRHRVLVALGSGNKPVMPLTFPKGIIPVRRHRPGHAELATKKEAKQVVHATLRAYYHPRNYWARLQSLW